MPVIAGRGIIERMFDTSEPAPPGRRPLPLETNEATEDAPGQAAFSNSSSFYASMFRKPRSKRLKPVPMLGPIALPHYAAVLGQFGIGVLDVLTATQVLDVLEAAPPTAQTVVLAHELQSRVLGDLDTSRLLSVWVRIESWVVSRTDIAIVGVAGDEPPSSVDYPREEAALAMRLSPRSGAGRVSEARQRTFRLPELGRALADASLTRGQSYDLTAGVRQLDDELAHAVCALVLPVALKKSRSEFKQAIAKAILLVDADGAATRHERAKADRCVTLTMHPDGMADVYAQVTAVEGMKIFDALHDAATRDRLPGQRIDNARADALVRWAETAHSEPTAPRIHGRRSETRVVVTDKALLGVTNEPAILEGYGPIHPMIARALAPGSTLRRLITDELTGELLNFGRTTYAAPRALSDFVQARDTTCRLVGCAQPSRRSDLDHRKDWQDNGETDPDNLAPLCERHHVMKHKGNWHLIEHEGELMWITPVGRTYLVHREPVHPSHV